MRRRSFLATLAAGAAAGLAGCGQSGTRGEGTAAPATDHATTATTPTATDRPARTPPADPDLPVPESALRRGAARDAIAAITDPAFGQNWDGIEVEFDPPNGEPFVYRPELAPDDHVVGVERDGRARAYPLKVLRWHEVVNDDFGGPLLLSYCPLCRSGIAADREIEGESTTFGVSGWLWHSNLVMYDARTESLWSQIRAQAIRGPLVGTHLDLVPSRLTTWRTWREAHPDSAVLLPSPLSGTVRGPLRINYEINLYENRVELNEAFELNPDERGDGRLRPYVQVLGIANGETARAYPLFVVEESGLVNDRVGDLPVVVAATRDRTLVAYDRRIDGRTLSFSPAEGNLARAGESRWDLSTGRAVDGRFAGRRLEAIGSASSMYWFAWLDFYPETTVFGRE